MKEAFVVWVSLISLTSFVLFGMDKRKAIKGNWRIKENTLILLCLIGGGAGGYLAMHLFHHKTRHIRFRIIVPFSIMLWIGIGLFLFLR